jgi:hypothetical protein
MQHRQLHILLRAYESLNSELQEKLSLLKRKNNAPTSRFKCPAHKGKMREALVLMYA